MGSQQICDFSEYVPEQEEPAEVSVDFNDDEDSLPDSCEEMERESESPEAFFLHNLLNCAFSGRFYRIFRAGQKYVKKFRLRSQLYGIE